MQDSLDKKEQHTFYANTEGIATIVCPACGYVKTINAFKAGVARKKIKTRCKCEHIFKFIIEIRTIYRKEVDFTGQCEHVRLRKRETVQIKDLSQNGIGLKHPAPFDITTGDRLKIAFRLDNAMSSKISLLVEVTRIDDQFIGARFIGPKPDPALGFFLQS